MYLRAFVFTAIVVLLAGCADWAGRQKDQTIKYVGKTVEILYPEYGVPVGRASLRDGGQFLEFEYLRGSYLCTAKVVTNSKGIVMSIKVGGQNGCVMPF